MGQKEKLLIIDGHSIVNRAFYGVNSTLSTKSGQFTNAIYGFLSMLFKFVEDEKPNYIAVCFDLSKPTFRHLHFSDYKGNRTKFPEELRSQIPILKQFLNSMNISIFEKEGYEADDVLATIAKVLEKQKIFTTIVSGDRDLLQVASEFIKIKIPKTKAGKTEIENYFANDVLEKYSVTPKQFIEVKALMGDTSDNVPGVPSIGEKTAIKIINQFDTVENAIENFEQIKPKKASQMLNEYKEQARLSRFLVEIDTNVPLDFTVSNLKMTDFFTKEFFDMCEKYELKSIISKFKTNVNFENDYEQFNLIKNDNCAKDYFNTLPLNEEIAYNIIFFNEEFFGISFYFANSVGTFVMKSDNFSEEQIITIFKPFFSEKYKKISYNLKNDIVFLHKYNINIENVIFETMLASYILNPTKSKYDYEHLASDFLNIQYPELKAILGERKNKKGLFELEQDAWLNYCCRHSKVSFLCKPIMENLITQNEQQYLFFNIELPLTYVLAHMQILGIGVCEEELFSYGQILQKEIDNISKEIYWLANDDTFNINSPKQIGKILFEDMGIKGGKKTATGWSTSADILEKLADDNEIIRKILQYRTYSKLKSTYVDGLLAVLNKDTKRIHSNFNQMATATGRLSSTEPNLQNIPIKLELGHKIRKVFKPEEGFIFIDADYSQIELRVLAHLSQDKALMDAFNKGQDIHKITASQIFNKNIDDISSFERSAAKAINFGLIYGKQAFSLAKELNITKKEAENYIDQYFEKYPTIKHFLDNVILEAKKNGFVKTIFNRKRDISEINSSNFIQKSAAERIAMNTPIQGAAADIIKIAMIKVFERIKKQNLKSRLILQVHDELLIETFLPEQEIIKTILIEEMQNCIEFSVKLLIDIKTGVNWYDAK